MAEIKVGQRYTLYPGTKKGFIGEVISIVSWNSKTCAELRVVQDLGYGCRMGYVWPREPVTSCNYELLEGQEAP
jgi:hypothetical protein